MRRDPLDGTGRRSVARTSVAIAAALRSGADVPAYASPGSAHDLYRTAVAREAARLYGANGSASMADAIDVGFGLTDPRVYGLTLSDRVHPFERADVRGRAWALVTGNRA